MQNALNTIKLQKISHQCIQLEENNKEKKQEIELQKSVIKPRSHQLCVSQTLGAVLVAAPPSHPPPLPVRKSSNINIFNPNKNVKKSALG